MVKFDTNSTFKRLRNRYRLVVMNDDTYEEVVTFKLSRLSVYVLLSAIFVVLVGLTVALIVFTPLKYYIPGYDDLKIGREYRQLKYRTDSLEQQVNYQARYIDGLKKVLQGNVTTKLDTTKLALPKEDGLAVGIRNWLLLNCVRCKGGCDSLSDCSDRVAPFEGQPQRGENRVGSDFIPSVAIHPCGDSLYCRPTIGLGNDRTIASRQRNCH